MSENGRNDRLQHKIRHSIMCVDEYRFLRGQSEGDDGTKEYIQLYFTLGKHAKEYVNRFFGGSHIINHQSFAFLRKPTYPTHA